jgi:hypothetical protein
VYCFRAAASVRARRWSGLMSSNIIDVEPLKAGAPRPVLLREVLCGCAIGWLAAGLLRVRAATVIWMPRPRAQ